MDPLSASVLTLQEVRDMVTEMMIAQADYLPQFGGQLPRAVKPISIPADVVRADVPLDPALVIANRFIKLAEA
jgi:alpha-galactosidase